VSHPLHGLRARHHDKVLLDCLEILLISGGIHGEFSIMDLVERWRIDPHYAYVRIRKVKASQLVTIRRGQGRYTVLDADPSLARLAGIQPQRQATTAVRG
jgi:hypothetical protein